MKTGTLIGWILVACVIALAIAAAFVVKQTIASLNPPSLFENRMASLWKDSFNAKTSDIIASRQSDLSLFSSGTFEMPGAGYQAVSLEQNFGSRQHEAKYSIERSLESAVLTGPLDVSEGYQVGLPYVNDALDEADALYSLRGSQGTEIAVEMYFDAMEQEAPFYLRHLGFRTLAGAVTRGVINYREMGSLPIYDRKSTFYQNESDTNLVNLNSIRQETENLLADRLGELDDRYDLLLAMLTDRVVQSMAINGTQVLDEHKISSIKELIQQHLAELSMNPRVGPWGSGASMIPEIGSNEWIDLENEISAEFRRMSD
jgi:hypothetical protein